jgi:hypothetical protein
MIYLKLSKDQDAGSTSSAEDDEDQEMSLIGPNVV